MSLRTATLLAIIGLCYTFALRATGTFLPDLFRDILVAQVNGILHLLASLTAVLFFAYFLTCYVRKGETKLKSGTVLALVGSSLMSLLLLKGLLPILDDYTFRNLAGPHFIEPIVPWVSSILILLFFIIFHKQTLRRRQRKLQQATLWAIIGSSIGVLVRTFVLLIYLPSGEARWFSDFPTGMQIALFPIFAFGFVAVFYFFWFFYREETQIS
jgi:hypothetical protein